MSRRDVEELIKQLQDAAKDSPDCVSLDRSLFDEAVANLRRLEQALDNRPSLIKKLNEKIIKLEGELEILRNETRVNELEKKVQRLEGELQRSYATKNFTLKNGLLEIEKAYREFICGSPAVQSLWDEITLLLLEDKESLPQHILARRNTTLRRSLGDTAITETPPHPPTAPPGSDTGPQSTLSYVQQQVDKFKDYSFTPGTMDPHDPNHPANLNAAYGHQYFPGATPSASYGGAPDARAGEAVDDRPTGLDDRMTHLREQYNDSTGGAAPLLEPHWGSVVPAPSPLRPVSLFSTGGDGKAPDASALEACRDELNSSLEHLRALFAQYDWAPTPLPLTPGGAAAAPGQHSHSHAAAAADGAAPEGQQRQQRQLPDASVFTNMAESLEVSVERLREYFAQMHWAPGGAVPGPGGSGTESGPGAAAAPDARYFDSQADVILASVHQLRRQFQEAAEAAAAAAAAAAATGSGSAGGAGTSHAGAAGGDSTNGGSSAAATAVVVPDARYFETQADAIAASVNELLRLYERSAATMVVADGAGGGLGPWASATAEAAVAAGALDSRAALTPDARAGESVADQYDASVQPLVDLFSAFMAHMDATRGSAGASGPWRLGGRGVPSQDGAADAAAASGVNAEPLGEGGAAGSSSPPPEAAELIQLFAKYARGWPATAAAAAALRVPSRVGGGLAAASPMGSMATFPDTQPSGELQLVYGDGVGGAGAAATGPVSPAAPPVRFRIRIDASDAGGGGSAVAAHLSPAPSAASLADSQSLQRRSGADGADDGAAVGALTPGPAAGRSPAPAAAPVEVLLASLEARHGPNLAASPEAVAVWRDLLALLGLDPNSRPLPTHGSPLPTPSRRSASGTPLRATTPVPRLADVAAASAAGGGGSGNDVVRAVTDVSGDSGLREMAAEAGPAEAEATGTSRKALRRSSSINVIGASATSGGAIGAEVEALGAGASFGDAAEAGEAAERTGKAGGDAGARLGAETGAGSAAEAEGESSVAARSPLSDTDVMAATPAVEAAEAEAAATASGSYGSDRQEVPHTPEDAGGYDVHRGSDGSGPGSSDGHQLAAAAAAAPSGDMDTDTAAAVAGGGAGLQEGELAGGDDAAARIPADSEGPGLVAGGVRFQIRLSEITPADQPETPSALQPQQLLQFRANLNDGGVDQAALAAAEAELVQLREVRQTLSEQLGATQELVRLLNRQLTMTLESRDDLMARVETLGEELSTERADAYEARIESDMFMRELVDAKVQLAEVQGEYMQIYLALKKALGNEKGMIAKIDELERILAVVGPGDVSVDDEYGSTVGQVSTMVTPRDDGGDSGPAIEPPARVGTGTAGGAGPGSEAHQSAGGRSDGGASVGRRSLGEAVAIALRKPSGGGRSSSGGSSYGAGGSGR